MKNSYPLLGRYVIPDMPSADELLPYLRQMDRNRWYSNFGPLVTQLEDRLSLHLSAPDDIARFGPLHLTTMMTCYHALQIGLQLFQLPPAANVLVPAVTFPACPLAVKHARAVPVLADVDPATWHLTPTTARQAAAIMPIHAVMPVAVYGVPVDVEAWDAFVVDTGIPVIIDAAAAFEAQAIPQHSLIAHSLHATKPFSVGEGGILISRNPDHIEKARQISNFGTHIRITLQDGSNAKMSEYHGAVGLAQLDRWIEVKKRRHDIFTRYRAAITKAVPDLRFQEGIDRAITSAVMLHSDACSAGDVLGGLNANGIAAHRMYLPPLYHHPYFADLVCLNTEGHSLSSDTSLEQKAGMMEHSEAMYRSVFGVPFHAFLDEEDMAHVVETLVAILNRPQHLQTKAR